MASILSVFSLILVIALAVGQIHAAAFKPTDLDDSNVNKNETSSVYKSIDEEHLTVNESKVVIDFYTPAQPTESSELTDKNATPFAQLVINQPNESAVKQQQPNAQNSGQPIVENTKANSLQLIPPADVNPSIKLQKDSPQKQGQIIIRYEQYCTFSNNLLRHCNFVFVFQKTVLFSCLLAT